MVKHLDDIGIINILQVARAPFLKTRISLGLELDAVEQESIRLPFDLRDGADGVEDALRFGGPGQGVQDTVPVPLPATAWWGLDDAPRVGAVGRARRRADTAVAEGF